MDGDVSHKLLIVEVEPKAGLFRYGAPAGHKKAEIFIMRKLIIATVALAFVSSSAFAQTAAPSTGGDTMSKGDTMKKTTKKKKSAKKTGDDAMTKQ
jgi:hypothetical protein